CVRNGSEGLGFLFSENFSASRKGRGGRKGAVADVPAFRGAKAIVGLVGAEPWRTLRLLREERFGRVGISLFGEFGSASRKGREGAGADVPAVRGDEAKGRLISPPHGRHRSRRRLGAEPWRTFRPLREERFGRFGISHLGKFRKCITQRARRRQRARPGGFAA